MKNGIIEDIIKSKLNGKYIPEIFIKIIAEGMIGKERLLELSEYEVNEQIENIARELKSVQFKELNSDKESGRFYLNGECIINIEAMIKAVTDERPLEDIAVELIDTIIHEIDMHSAECRKDGSKGTFLFDGHRYGKALDEGVVSCCVSKLLYKQSKPLMYKNLRHRFICSNYTNYSSNIWNRR